MKKIALLVVLLLFTVCMSSQNEKVIDSLKKELKIAKTSNDKVKIYYALSKKISNPIISNKYIDSNLVLCNLSNNIKYKGLNYYKKGYNLITLGKIDSAKTYLDNSIKIADKNNFKEIHYEAYKELAYIFEIKNNIDTAQILYQKSFDAAKLLDNDKLINATRNLADILLQKGDFIGATKKYLDCKKLNKERINKLESSILFGLGNVHYRLKKYSEAIQYYKKSLIVAKKINTSNYNINVVKLGLIEVLILSEKYDDAFVLINEILKTKNLSPIIKGSLYSNLGLIYSFHKKFTKAEEYFEKSIAIANKTKNKKYKIIRLFRLASMYSQNKMYKKSDIKMRAYLKEFPNFLDIRDFSEVYRILVKNQLGMYGNESNIEEFDKFIIFKDSLNTSEYINSINNLKVKYQTQQKENKILELSNKNNLQKASLAQSRLLNISGASLLLLLSGLGFFFWHKKKQQQKLAVLKTTVKTSENEKKRIGKELHDGIAGSLIRLVHDTEDVHVDLSHKLLHTYNEIRNLSHQLDNTPMHGEVFMERLIDLIPKNKKDQTFKFKISPNHLELQEPFGTHIYRIIQELITNNLKYAKAQKTELSILKKENKLTITYKDDGIGMAKFKKGNGYKNIEDRVTLMKGKLELNLKLEKGFELRIVIPYS